MHLMLTRRDILKYGCLLTAAMAIGPARSRRLQADISATRPATLWRPQMLPVIEPNGWQEEDYYCWGGTVAVGPGEHGDQTIHFFGTRWPRWSGFLGWLWRSEICRATSDKFTGPFTTREVIATARTAPQTDGRLFWDHNSVFNSTVFQEGLRTALFYTGTQHSEHDVLPDDDIPQTRLKMTEIRDGWARMRQRIGVMIAGTPAGPWHRPDHPLLDCAENNFQSNPTICRAPEGRFHLYYKTLDEKRSTLVFAAATADRVDGPYTPYPDNPILQAGRGMNIEDHHVWVEDGVFNMLFKDMSGRIVGTPSATGFIQSRDGFNWDMSQAVLAYKPGWPTIDGWHSVNRMEQTNLHLRDGRPFVLYSAVLNTDERADPLHPFHRRLPEADRQIELRSRNVAIQLMEVVSKPRLNA